MHIRRNCQVMCGTDCTQMHRQLSSSALRHHRLSSSRIRRNMHICCCMHSSTYDVLSARGRQINKSVHAPNITEPERHVRRRRDVDQQNDTWSNTRANRPHHINLINNNHSLCAMQCDAVCGMACVSGHRQDMTRLSSALQSNSLSIIFRFLENETFAQFVLLLQTKKCATI